MLEENDSFQEFISQFKDGVSDALLLGKSADVNVTSAYKQGYDFGLTLWAYEREDAKEA